MKSIRSEPHGYGAEGDERIQRDLAEARRLLTRARFKLAEASGYVRASDPGVSILAPELDWLREDITAFLNDTRNQSAPTVGRKP